MPEQSVRRVARWDVSSLETWPRGRRHSPAKGAYGQKPVSTVRRARDRKDACEGRRRRSRRRSRSESEGTSESPERFASNPSVGLRSELYRVWRRGREVEGTPLLREHAGKNLHRRFESVRLRQFAKPAAGGLCSSSRVDSALGRRARRSKRRPSCTIRRLAPVAQLDRVLGYEPRGRGFESCRARQSFRRP